MRSIEIINERGKTCRFDYNKESNVVTIYFSGFFELSDGAVEFAKQYGKICSEVDKDDTILILDVRELEPFEEEFIDNLGVLYMDYVTFKKVYWVNSSSKFTNLQTKELIEDLGIDDKFIFVNSLSNIQ